MKHSVSFDDFPFRTPTAADTAALHLLFPVPLEGPRVAGRLDDGVSQQEVIQFG
jgi:hypothetical protein